MTDYVVAHQQTDDLGTQSIRKRSIPLFNSKFPWLVTSAATRVWVGPITKVAAVVLRTESQITN